MATMSPSFSIVTVCFNSGRTIERALRSVAEQSWTQREHIVIDGGSTDETAALVDRYRDSVSSFVSAPDRGIYDAMNKGVARAGGNVIAFLNSDDWYIDNAVLSDVAANFADSTIEAVYGDVDYVQPDNLERVVRHYSSAPFRPDRLASGWMPAHPALFVRRAVFERVGPFKIDYKIAADFDFIVRAFGKNQLRSCYLPRVLTRMQTGGASTSGLGSTLLLNREMMRALRENGVRASWPRLLSRYNRKLLQLAPWTRR